MRLAPHVVDRHVANSDSTHDTSPRRATPWRAAGCVLLALLAMSACDRAPSGAREWKPEDHDQASPAGQSQVAARTASASEGVDPGLVELAWQKNCSRCHGSRGRGDGPEGPMVKASDLTRAEWQARVTDDEMAESIRKGKNKMPAFDLPIPVIDGLVKRIRSQRARE